LAVGYVYLPGSDEDVINGLHCRLDEQARREGLHLTDVFVDRQTSGDGMDLPGLTFAVDEIARCPDAVLLVPGLDHLPTGPTLSAAFAERFTTVVTEIRTLVAGPTGKPRVAADTAWPAGGADQSPVAEAGRAPSTGWGRARLTGEGRFEVTVQPEDDVAAVSAALRQLPAAARFLESFGDVETTLVFTPAPTDSSSPLGDRMAARTVPTSPLGRELVGLTTDDLAEGLRAALADVPLGPDDERLLAWLANQTADRALAVAALLRRARVET
jgi:uncharacterized repeat protein (TIGR03917 family)